MKYRNSISLLFGILVAVATDHFFYIGIFPSIIAGLIGFMLLRRFIGKIPKNEKGDSRLTPQMKQARETADTGMDQIRRIRKQTIKIQDNAVAEKIKEICGVGVRILTDIRDNPEDLRRAKSFTTYYLDAFEKIVTRYVDLSGKKEINPGINASLVRVEEILDQIKGTYEKQLSSLLEDDILDLNTEISLLEKTMKLEG